MPLIDRHGIFALDFSDVVVCKQLIRGVAHVSVNLSDLLLTESIPPIGSSDHRSLA